MQVANENGKSDTNLPPPSTKAYKLPPLFPAAVVYEAFDGLLTRETVRRRLKELKAVEGSGHLLIKPDVLQDHYPRVYRECCRILVARGIEEEQGAA